VLIEALRKADRDDLLDELPTTTRIYIEELSAIPSPEEILTAPTALAASLAELRQIPRWWDGGWTVRTAVAQRQGRGGLPQGIPTRNPGQTRARRLLRVLQKSTSPPVSDPRLVESRS